MDWQSVWIFLHVMLLVYWLGADIGVFYCSFHIRRADYPKETRLAVLKISGFINQFPLAVGIFILPVGLQLADGLGLSPITGAWLLVPWVLAVAWFLLNLRVAKLRGSPAGKRLAQIDLGIRVALILVLVVSAIWTFVAGEPWGANWVALKVLVFAYVLTCGIGIRVTYRNAGAVFGKLAALPATTPELEAEITRLTKAVKPWVLTLWAGLVVMAAIGITQPSF